MINRSAFIINLNEVFVGQILLWLWFPIWRVELSFASFGPSLCVRACTPALRNLIYCLDKPPGVPVVLKLRYSLVLASPLRDSVAVLAIPSSIPGVHLPPVPLIWPAHSSGLCGRATEIPSHMTAIGKPNSSLTPSFPSPPYETHPKFLFHPPSE